MPFHTHALRANFNAGDVNDPIAERRSLGTIGHGLPVSVQHGQQHLVTMAFQALPPAGGSLPHNNMPPYLTVTFIIAMQGVFPPRG